MIEDNVSVHYRHWNTVLFKMTKFSVVVVILVQLLTTSVKAQKEYQSNRSSSQGSEEFKALKKEIDSLRDYCKADFSDNRTIPLAFELQSYMEKLNGNDSLENLEKYENLKETLPLNVQNLVWGSKIRLHNKNYPTEYLYAMDENAEDTQNRRVFSSGGFDKQGVWNFIPQSSGKYFLIQSDLYNQYLCPGTESSKHDSDRRRCFVQHTSSPEACLWIIEILDKNELRIKSKKYNEYLYAAMFTFDWNKRFVFTYNQNKRCDNSCIWTSNRTSV